MQLPRCDCFYYRKKRVISVLLARYFWYFLLIFDTSSFRGLLPFSVLIRESRISFGNKE